MSGPMCDLHIHTYFSDGALSPEEVAAACKEKGLGLAAVCDHNTTEGWPRFAAACRAAGVACIPGVEVDADWNGHTVHLLGYGCDDAHPGFAALLAANRQEMEALSIELIAAMAEDYPQISPAEYETFQREPTHGGWKGIDYLGSKGFDNHFPEVMHWYADYHIPPRRFESAEATIGLIHAAGGKAVLAHPYQRLPAETLEDDLTAMADAGLDGLECHYPSHSLKEARWLVDFCRGRGLLVTAGGDGHGGFAASIAGVEYGIGQVAMPAGELDLAGLWP